MLRALVRPDINTHFMDLLSIIKLMGWLGVCALVGCEQYNPNRHWQTFSQERQTTLKTIPVLQDDGRIPIIQPQETATHESIAAQKYASFCAACHGNAGQADTSAILAMNPVPRNLTDPTWQDSVDDAHIAKVIKLGGGAVGLSVTMAPWGSVLSDEEINKLVELIRAWKADPE